MPDAYTLLKTLAKDAKKAGKKGEKLKKAEALQALFKSGDEAKIRAELTKRGFSQAEIDELKTEGWNIFPPKPGNPSGFWWW